MADETGWSWWTFHRIEKGEPVSPKLVCVAKVIDGRIWVSEQLLRGGCRTDRTASDDAIGPEKRPSVLPKPAHGMGTSPSLISTHKASMIVTTLRWRSTRSLQMIIVGFHLPDFQVSGSRWPLGDGSGTPWHA